LAHFHTELELIPLPAHDSLYIKQPLQLEQYIIEGSFTRVWDARADVPHESYLFFMDRLMDTVRYDVLLRSRPPHAR
jgi:26S proteasome regulatory subunit N12